MTKYLVELYVPRSGAGVLEDAAARARSAAAELRDEGLDVSYVRSTYVAEDETCFHVYEAEGPELVEEAVRRAGAAFSRVAAATETNEQREKEMT